MQPKALLQTMDDHGFRTFYGVPDSTLKHLCACLNAQAAEGRNIICANEGAAIGLGIGHHLATGEVPVAYMQNSGLGNSVNPLLSLGDPDVYGIPMLLIIGWRGEPGKTDEPQHVKQGRITLELLQTMEIPYSVIDGDLADAQKAVAAASKWFSSNKAPYALVVKKGAFEAFSVPDVKEQAFPMTREEAVDCILKATSDDDIIVSTTGMASREVFELREANNQGHQQDFLTVGGMGHCSQIAMGVAMAKPDRRVVCIDGDGAAIMHMGSMAVIGASHLPNLTHIVLNNGVHDSVGGQPNVARDVDLTKIAQACGYSASNPAEDMAALHNAVTHTEGAQDTRFIEVFVRRGHRADLGRPTLSPAQNKAAFMEFVG